MKGELYHCRKEILLVVLACCAAVLLAATLGAADAAAPARPVRVHTSPTSSTSSAASQPHPRLSFDGCSESCAPAQRPSDADVIVTWCGDAAAPAGLADGAVAAWACAQSTAQRVAGADLTATLSEGSDVPVTWNTWCGDPRSARPAGGEQLRAELLYAESGECVAWRDAYVRELAAHANVTSVGTCAHNADDARVFPECASAGPTLEDRLPCILSRSRFVIAFEDNASARHRAPLRSAVAPDPFPSQIGSDAESVLVSPKFFRTVCSGAVPVYWGPGGERRFFPTSSFRLVDARDFSSALDLAEYLALLARNPRLLARYSDEWRKEPLSSGWELSYERGVHNLGCRLCKAAGDVITKRDME
eukprot:m51a1_g7527 hypothetical protein (362) ;mRNA; f:32563-33718